jgi:pimeloyl-ACP methyl ester carboxylesterase
MGGAITLLYALLYPEELKGIILISTGARLRVSPDYLDLCREPGENNFRWLEGQKRHFNGVESDIHQVLMRRAEEIGPGVELNDLLSCDHFDVMERVHKIKLPTAIICGSEDAMTPVKYSDYLAQQIKGARKDIIPGANHFVQLEKYHQVNAKIEEFLGRLR